VPDRLWFFVSGLFVKSQPVDDPYDKKMIQPATDGSRADTSHNRWRRLWQGGVILLLLVGIVMGSRWVFLRAPDFLIVEEDPAPSALVAVISGDLPEIHYGIDLYHQEKVDKLLFIGDHPVQLAVISEEPFDVVEKPWDEIAAHLAVTAGVDRQDLLLAAGLTQSTYGRVAQIVDLAHDNGYDSLIVMSDLLHSARIRFVLNKLLAETTTVAVVTPTPQSYYPPVYRFDRDTWWQSEEDVKYLFEESVKMMYYRLRYGWGAN